MLADRYRIARFDTLGFGRSSVPGPAFGWTLDGLADDVVAVARAAGADRFHVVGESLGGTVALRLGSRRPDVVLSVTAGNASHRGGSIQRAKEWREFIGARGMAAWAQLMTPLRLDRARVPDAKWQWFERVQAAADADAVLDLADLLIAATSPPSSTPSGATLLLARRKPIRAAGRHGGHARAHRRLRAQVFGDARHGCRARTAPPGAGAAGVPRAPLPG